jgi:hypothetical protein
MNLLYSTNRKLSKKKICERARARARARARTHTAPPARRDYLEALSTAHDRHTHERTLTHTHTHTHTHVQRKPRVMIQHFLRKPRSHDTAFLKRKYLIHRVLESAGSRHHTDIPTHLYVCPQHTSAYVSIRGTTQTHPRTLPYRNLCDLEGILSIRQHTSAYASIRQHTRHHTDTRTNATL